MITYPGLPGPELSDYLPREASPARYGPGTEFHIGHISMVANTGTYLDSPFHRFAGATDVADLPLHSVADLDSVVVRVGAVQRAIDRDALAAYDVAGRAVLVHTGWDCHWGSERYGTRRPFLTAAAADCLVEQQAGLVGIDSLNIDDTSGPSRPAHTALLAAGIPIVKHLCGLDQLPPSGFRFHAAPPPGRWHRQLPGPRLRRDGRCVGLRSQPSVPDAPADALSGVAEARLYGLAACCPDPEFTDNIAIIAADGGDAPPTQHYFHSRSVSEPTTSTTRFQLTGTTRSPSTSPATAATPSTPAGSSGRSAPWRKPAPTTNGAPMLLDKKTAIVYGAAGAIGSAVARAYAREGADVHLAGRTQGTLEQVAQRIRADGGAAHVTCLDVLDRAAVEEHASAVAAATGGIDACFNATSNDDLQGIPVTQMQPDDFLRPVIKAVTAHFNIATAAGRQMTRRGHGVILVMAGGREAIPRLGGSHVAWAALAGLCRQLAAEFGPYGVRVNWLLSPGSPGYNEHDDPRHHTTGNRDETAAPGTEGLLPRHQPSYEEVANIAVFAASDWARTITAAEINFTGGAVID